MNTKNLYSTKEKRMKKVHLLLVLGLAMLLVFVIAAPAFARSGSYWPYTTGNYDNAGVTSDGSVVNPSKVYLIGPLQLMEPGDGTPHDGYVDVSAKCRFCHAVHGAGYNPDQLDAVPATERLLRTTVADACLFCHVAGENNFSTKTVYDGVAANYTTTSGSRPAGYSGHMSRHRSATSYPNITYEGCASCHSVHGANIIADSPILKDDPAKGVTSHAAVADALGGYGSFAGPVTNQRDFCQDCHNGTKRTSADGATVVSVDNDHEFEVAFEGCATYGGNHCHSSVASTPGDVHAVQFGIDASSARNGRSHVMTTALQNEEGTTIAYKVTQVATEGVSAATNSCTTCHTSDPTTQSSAGGGGFPHRVASQDLISGYDAVTHLDKVCLDCHQSADGTAGVGETF